MQRTKNSILNISASFSLIFVKTVLNFFVKTIFIKVLGEYYLGISGLFTNILYMLSLSELGISAAINFNLYKPLAEKDYDKVSSLMKFYKKAYRVIGFITLGISVVLFFFLKYLIKDYNSIPNVNIIYFLYVINTVSTYFISYKEVLIQADQSNYKLAKINTICALFQGIFQIIILLLTKNFILYLCIEIAANYIRRIVTNIYISKRYDFVDFKTSKNIDKKDLKETITNIKALMVHKIGDYVIDGTDNIIISKFLGLAISGFYTSYTGIISMVNEFIRPVFSGITASLGNLVALETKETKLRVFNISNFFAFVCYSMSSILFINLLNPFINIWIGNKYILSDLTVIMLIISFYITGMKYPVYTIKTVAGLNKQDKNITIIQSILNIIISVILVKKIGIAGVVIGTVISNILPVIFRPFIIYKHIFEKSTKDYWIDSTVYTIVLLAGSVITLFITSYLKMNNLITIILGAIICFLVYSAILIIVFRKRDEFKYFLNLLKKPFKKSS